MLCSKLIYYGNDCFSSKIRATGSHQRGLITNQKELDESIKIFENAKRSAKLVDENGAKLYDDAINNLKSAKEWVNSTIENLPTTKLKKAFEEDAMIKKFFGYCQDISKSTDFNQKIFKDAWLVLSSSHDLRIKQENLKKVYDYLLGSSEDYKHVMNSFEAAANKLKFINDLKIYPKWVYDLIKDQTDALKILFKTDLKDKTFFELFDGATDARKNELFRAWKVLESSDLRKKATNLEVVRNYQSKSDFDVTGLKIDFENALDKNAFITDLMKASKQWENNFSNLFNLTFNGNIKVPFKYVEDGCPKKAYILANSLKEKYRVKKAFAFWVSPYTQKGNLKLKTGYAQDVPFTYSHENIYQNWRYHVAVIVEIEENGKIVQRVVDPNSMTELTTIERWMQKMNAENFDKYSNTNNVSSYVKPMGTIKASEKPAVFIVDSKYNIAKDLHGSIEQIQPINLNTLINMAEKEKSRIMAKEIRDALKQGKPINEMVQIVSSSKYNKADRINFKANIEEDGYNKFLLNKIKEFYPDTYKDLFKALEN